MHREIIHIDEEKCNGCGLCVPSCIEGALRIVNGKAKLVSEVYCDGLGACIGECPQGALSIERREAEPFDEDAVLEQVTKENGKKTVPSVSGGCPGSAIMNMLRETEGSESTASATPSRSHLGHWPVQLRLIPYDAPFLKDADILVCADCVPFAVPDMHSRYIKDHAVLVGCPKLDDLALYREKLAAIFKTCSPNSITVLRMEVPCCSGLTRAVVEARNRTMPDMPVDVHEIFIDGDIEKSTV